MAKEVFTARESSVRAINAVGRAGNDVAHYYAAKITDSDSSRRYTSSLRSVIEVINDLKYRKYGFV